MKLIKALSIAFLLFAAVSASAYAYDYLMADRPTSWGLSWRAGTTQITTLTSGDWDDGYFDLALSANYRFYFYGKLVTHLRIWTNGYVTFGFGAAPSDTSDPSNDAIPSTDNPNGYAAPWWDDWDLRTTGAIYYEQWNSAGYYFTHVEWRAVPHLSGGGAVTFAATFYSHTHTNLPDMILFRYNDVVVGNATYDYGVGATVGVEHPAGTQSRKYSYNEANLSTADYIYFVPFIHTYGGTELLWSQASFPCITLWRPDGGNWFYRQQDGSTIGPFQWGTRGDVPLPGDYDGDGDADEVVVRPTTYHWFAAWGEFAPIQFGDNGDIPVPADYDGNGSIDLAVFRPNPGTWFIRHLDTAISEVINWGTQGDIPLPADYDNDNKADCAIFRPSTNTWFIRKSSNPAQAWVMTFGTDGDVPNPANIQTAYATLTVFRPSDGNWYTYNQSTGAWGVPFNWGQNGDVAVPGDENDGGLTDAAVFRPQNGNWFIRNALSFPVVVTYGTAGDIPMFRKNFLIVGPASGNPDH